VINEDELPEGYPYDLMYPFSIVDGVRLFPEVDEDGWVSVEDCRPVNKFVQLIASDGIHIFVIVCDRAILRNDYTFEERKDVTHWRPFPLPPKEKR